MASSFLRFLDHAQQGITVGKTPLDAWSARRRDLYLYTQHSQQTNIHTPGGIRTHNLSRRAAADLRLRPRGHWDRLTVNTIPNIQTVITASLSNSDKNEEHDKYILLGKRGLSLRHLGSFRFAIQDYGQVHSPAYVF